MILGTVGLIVRTLVVAFLIGLAVPARLAHACAPAPRLRDSVRILDESAFIVWSPDSHTEHFIRRASFDATGSDFGFLVPTPSQPALAEVDNHAFDYAEDLIRPRTVVEESHGVDFTPLVMRMLAMFTVGEGSRSVITAARPVHVLDVERIAGYDAVVLEADNPSALSLWLANHDYASGPDLIEWLNPYVAAHWKITAFKIAKGSNGNQVGTSAVRMSFATDRPFFPYREPSNGSPASPDLSSSNPSADGAGRRGLSVLFIGDGRVEGHLGADHLANQSSSWPGRTTWSDQLSADDLATLTSRLELTSVQLPQNAWLTAFEDLSSPRPGIADLYFGRSEQQSPVAIHQVVSVDKRIPVPADLVLGLVGIFFVIRFFRRRARRNELRGNAI